LFAGVRQGEKRKVGLLEGHQDLAATGGISCLTINQRRDLLSRIQRWIDGANGPKRWFHNFTNEAAYLMCFVFKAGEHRFYGYLCHPLPNTNPGLQACVLCSHAVKHEWETDPAEKALVRRWSQNGEAKAALAKVFDDALPDDKSTDGKEKKRKSKWKM
jgi:hypothetical protein